MSRRDLLVVPNTRRVKRYKKDAVGNDLSAVLRWCSTHNEPVWQYDDGSYECPWSLVTRVIPGEHAIIDGPWEVKWTYHESEDRDA